MIWNDIKRTVGIGCLVVQRRWKVPLGHGQAADHGFQGSRSAKRVGRVVLGSADRNRSRSTSKDGMDTMGFVAVVNFGRTPMGIDVLDLFGIGPGIRKRILDGPDRRLTIRMR